MVLTEDQVNIFDIKRLRSRDFGLSPARTVECLASKDLPLERRMGEQQLVQVHTGRHDDRIKVQPPDPLRIREGVECLCDSWKFRPYRVGATNVVF